MTDTDTDDMIEILQALEVEYTINNTAKTQSEVIRHCILRREDISEHLNAYPDSPYRKGSYDAYGAILDTIKARAK